METDREPGEDRSKEEEGGGDSPRRRTESRTVQCEWQRRQHDRQGQHSDGLRLGSGLLKQRLPVDLGARAPVLANLLASRGIDTRLSHDDIALGSHALPDRQHLEARGRVADRASRRPAVAHAGNRGDEKPEGRGRCGEEQGDDNREGAGRLSLHRTTRRSVVSNVDRGGCPASGAHGGQDDGSAPDEHDVEADHVPADSRRRPVSRVNTHQPATIGATTVNTRPERSR